MAASDILIIPPQIIKRVNPGYSEEARRGRIQGTSVYSLVVDPFGIPHDIEVISAAGYGLDEKGVEAIRQWRFTPAMQGGKTVSVRFTVEISFRNDLSFNGSRDERRIAYAIAVHDLGVHAKKQAAIRTIQKMAGNKYGPAMSLQAQWLLEGTELPHDEKAGVGWLRRAANVYDPQGLFLLGMYLMPADAVEGRKRLGEASVYGSREAQFFLGSKYEQGDGVAANAELARYYFRLCASRGMGSCQFHLGRLLKSRGDVKGDPVQALGWLELAASGDVPDADDAARGLRTSLSAEELGQVEKLKRQLLWRQ